MGLNEWIYFISTLLIIPVIIYAMYAQFKVSSTLKRARRIVGAGGYTGAQIADKLLKAANVNARVEQGGGQGLSDHYDPKRKAVVLSGSIYNSTDVGALGVAAHEVGHAIQDETGYAPLKIRNFIIPFCNVINRLLVPLIFIGIIGDLLLGTYGYGADFMVWVVLSFVVVYAISTLINLLTLPTEYNASKRALELLEASGAIASTEEKKEVKRVLNAAAMTYVAALAVSLLQLIRFLALFARMQRK